METSTTLLVSAACMLPLLLVLYRFATQQIKSSGTVPGCRKLGLRSDGNLKDEADPLYAQESPKANWAVKSLWIYPVKSCRGVELDHANVIATGLEYDRQFSFAQYIPATVTSSEALGNKDPFWSFLTQREQARMTQIKPQIWIPDPSVPGYSLDLPEVRSGGVVVIHYPSPLTAGERFRLFLSTGKISKNLSFSIPFKPTPEMVQKGGYTWDTLKIWKDWPRAMNMSSHIPPEFTRYLNHKNPIGLFRVNPDDFRQVFRCAPREDALGYQSVTGFADSYPLHIVNLASVHALLDILMSPIATWTGRRFRANIYVTGPPAWAEDDWKSIRIGQDDYHVACRTVRCKVTTTDQDTGERHASEPLNTLNKKRDIDAGAKNGGCFGMQIVPAKESGSIKVSDHLEVLKTGKHFYINL
ncbi:hypothetical protein MMC25_001922 [Agyrium rufum]|nr:hypothetical protein [Agyrium rufum]